MKKKNLKKLSLDKQVITKLQQVDLKGGALMARTKSRTNDQASVYDCSDFCDCCEAEA